MGPFLPLSCILLKFYIKPQHSWRPHDRPFVVSYWNSTSNHNSFEIIMVIRRLYLIEILHQTTTFSSIIILEITLYLIEILHQTTTYSSPLSLLLRCILLKFYIKPQRGNSGFLPEVVVSYWNSTSNHNTSKPFNVRPVVVSYWNSTSNHNSSLGCVWVISVVSYWNSTSNHNTDKEIEQYVKVVSYWNSTSNHNLLQEFVNCWRLYLIEILHQTTTQSSAPGQQDSVVSYWNSTSNHNRPRCNFSVLPVVSYWNSTSNHNPINGSAQRGCVVSYWNSTSNHNGEIIINFN